MHAKKVVVDFHTHLFPKHIRESRERYFSGEPAFELLYASPKSRMVGADDIVATMDEQGVDVSVVFGFPWQNTEIAKQHNDYIIAAAAKYPERLKGFCCLDPCDGTAVSEVERCLDNGLCGVGELAFYRSGIECVMVDSMTPVMELCLERDVPVLIHTNEPVGHQYPGKTENTLLQIYDLIRRFPENKIVLAHWGGGIFFYSVLKKEVKEVLHNVYYDTAASPFLYDPRIYRLAIEMAGLDKILLGTDYPLIKPKRYFQELEAAGLSREEIEQIGGGNAMRLFDG
ncbi:MAG: amidohydrolase family protein [Deltaproteobacteria bacterium]|nr:amidohydrolase family protein [Deltaproteobacteria bacterium]